MNIDEKTLESTTDINEIAKYDGFIAPDGSFYKVSIKNKHNPTHIEWAEYFVTRKTDYIKNLTNPTGSFLYIISRLKDKQDILIHFYGYIYYGHDASSRKPIIIYPDKEINEKQITKKQEDMLFNILRKNNELNDLNITYEDELNDYKYENYVDSYIAKIIEEGRKK